MQERLVRFHLFGQEFTFFSNASEDEVEAVIALLRQELESEDKLSRSSVPSNKMLVLGCLRMAAKYVQLHGEYNLFRQGQESMISHLVDKVSSALD
jgi:hypothetical protein